MCHGGISRAVTFVLIERAQGRASSYVSSDIGATDPGRWQFWQDFWKIGATSLVNVTEGPWADTTPIPRLAATTAHDILAIWTSLSGQSYAILKAAAATS
jgi:hypothetical protein